MLIYVDIDNTICTTSKDLNYNLATPLTTNIEKVNTWYDNGHTIVYWTARGTKTGLTWFQVTLKQLNKWGCKFHELKMGKPAYDVFVCDKTINWCNNFYPNF